MVSRRRKKKRSARRRNPFVAVVKLGLLAGVLMVVFLFSLIISMRVATRATEVVVPSLIRTDMEQARKKLEALGLGLAVEGEVYDASIPNGAVVAQLPTPGVRLKANGRVRVMVSLGVQHKPVPDLIGSTQRVARLMSQQSGYEIGHTSEIFLADVGSDQIIRQVPNPGSTEVLTARVDVLVGKKRVQSYIMPDFRDLNLNRVRSLIRKNGFESPKVNYTRGARRSRGKVVRQYPEAGNMLKENDKIILEVAS
ncbi:MAG: PASTA domain-containing protein [Acidobacteriota bacterium]|nr:PASTA domain-containing protein [Acidobacteriota bacterium]